MDTLIILAIVIILFVILAKKSKDIDIENKELKEQNKELKENVINEEELIETEEHREKFPYILSDTLLSSKEKKFYNSLKPITDKQGYIILCKMRLADIVKVPKDTYESLRWFNYIKAKHIDFTVCDKNFKIVALIEVDDYTHSFENRKKRDNFVNKIFEQLNIKLLHYKTWTTEQLLNDFSLKTENPLQTAVLSDKQEI
ncbi:MAG: DUF2726 domain-containing protein [Ruminiclostridium sp.]|nr:DUF2726 domain-containing protein [Ruminiclostridium sp.]